MCEIKESEVCVHCKRGRVGERMEEIAFQQWTDKGYVSCRATIPMDICDGCGSKSWGDAAEALIEEAVRRAYEKL